MALPTSRAPKGPREGWGLTGVTQRGQQDSEYRWVARRQWAGFPFPAGARHRGLVQPRIISGSPKAFWSPPGPPPAPSDPGPQLGSVGLKVSWAVGALKTRTGFLPGRSRTGAQRNSGGETEAQRGGAYLKVTQPGGCCWLW